MSIPFKVILYIALILAMMIGPGLIANTVVDESKAVNALTNLGFSNIHITGKSWLFVYFQGCDSNDSIKFDATASNPRGDKVNVIVCGGIFKGETVRSK